MTERGIKSRAAAAIHRTERAARLLLETLDNLEEVLEDCDNDSLSLPDESEFELGDWLEELSGIPFHSPLVGSLCWTTFETGDETYLLIDRLADGCELLRTRMRAGA
jgi:hypothetical protein